jgi:thiamine biosynthesis lipoprotein
MIEHRFRAMGCEVVIRGGGPGQQAAVEHLFRDRERVFSRFIADSELNRINATSGRPTLASAVFAATVEVAIQASRETDGLVDPTLGAAIQAAGYTRDFSELVPDARPPGPASGPHPVVVTGRIVGLPKGAVLDLNGVVKSLAVDDGLALLSGVASVSAGGDLAARGPLSVALPGGDVVELRRGALATSGRTKRWWFRAGEIQHHLLDPRTGRPSRTPWTEVTACGATCVAADVAAKAGFLLGDDGPGWLDARDIPARFMRADGSLRTTLAWDRDMAEATPCT